MSKQTTLLQTWGYEGNQIQGVPSSSSISAPTSSSSRNAPKPKMAGISADPFPEDIDDEEMILNHALEMSLREHQNSSRKEENSFSDEVEGFDSEAGKTWIYPTNYEERAYQFAIVKSCLFQNTLVTLPTGLGKTFIAAVVIYNFYRWFPSAKLVFMAPTKPLVAQQIEACFHIMGIPQIETIEMTGNVSIKVREKGWQQKRVFFLTPQVMSNDLSRGLFPAKDVKLLVVDEAHRAQGDYAYCQVVKELERHKSKYRVVALSATPGKDINAVKVMLQNLRISHIELRSEESVDIVPYTFQRKIEKVVVPFGAELMDIKAKFLIVLDRFITSLNRNGVLTKVRNSSNPSQYTKFGLLQSRNEFRQNPPSGLNSLSRGQIESDFACSITLYHAYDLLLQHGTRAFYKFMKTKICEQDGNRRLRAVLNSMESWQSIVLNLDTKFADDANNSLLNSSCPRVLSNFTQKSQDENIVTGHPKLEKLKEMVVEHFRNKQEENVPTRVMIFSQYRDSVQEIAACLHTYKPLIKVMEFVGQAGVKGKKGLSQKAQIEVVKRFREGGYNTLVATCVGEEGLDIGEVDLIVCYDVSRSPIRLVQRMGRTGRKRAGRIIVLVTEGKEEQTYNQSMYSKKSINKAITDKNSLKNFLIPSSRLIPSSCQPTVQKMKMIQRQFVSNKSDGSSVAPKKNRRISKMMKTNSDANGKLSKPNPIPNDVEGNDPSSSPLKNIAPKEKGVDPLVHSPPQDELSDFEIEILKDLDKKFEEEEKSGKRLEDDSFPSWILDDSRNSPIETEIFAKNKLEVNLNLVSKSDIETFDMDGCVRQVLNVSENVSSFSSELEANESQPIICHQDQVNCVAKQSTFVASPCFKLQLTQDKFRKTSTPKAMNKNSDLAQSTLNNLLADTGNGKTHCSSLDNIFGDSDLNFFTPTPVESSTSKKCSNGGDKTSLYSATQLVAMVNKISPSPLKKNGSKSFEKSNTEEDLFRTEDDDIFLNISEQNHTPAFKCPDLQVYEHVANKQTPKLKKTKILSVTRPENVPSEVDDSPVIIQRKKRKSHIALDFSDDFPAVASEASSTCANKKRSRLDQTSDSKSSETHDTADFNTSPKFRHKVSRLKRKKLKSKFIEDEAEQSSDGCIIVSSDENEENLDVFDESFIEDATQGVTLTQKVRYLKSVKSPRQHRKERKLPPITSDIFSQIDLADKSDHYEVDSFCVDNSHVEYQSQMDSLDLLESACNKKGSTKPQKKTVDKAFVSSSEEENSILASPSCSKSDKAVLERQKRLEKQKEMQEKFRQKAKQVEKPKSMSSVSSSDTTQSTPDLANRSSSNPTSIIVSSTEVHKVPELISCLKHFHSITVNVRFIPSAGFLISSRMAVERIMIGEFFNASNRSKIIEKCQLMNELYERPCLILESDKPTEDGVIPRSIHNQGQSRTKYVDTILAQLSFSKFQIVFTDDQIESANLLATMINKESKKSFSLPKTISNLSEKKLKFFEAIPGVSLGLAIIMASKFGSPRGLMICSVATLMSRLGIDEVKAKKIHDFFRKPYGAQLQQ